MNKCVVCGGQEFYLDAGYYYCNECQTQHEEKREEVTEFRTDPQTRLRKIRIRKDRSRSGAEQISGWTTWEQYNFILIGLANELIELGASMDIKMTLVQLWATYLGKLEVAFTSTRTQCVPKLSRRYNKKDAAIIYGRIEQKKKKKKSKSVGSGTSASSGISGYTSGGSSRAELQKHKKKLITSEYNKYIKSQNSESDAFSMTNQSLTSVTSVGSDNSRKNGERLKFNKYAKQETKKVKLLAKAMPVLKRKHFREKHITSSYAVGPQVIKPSILWGLLCLALRINEDKIHLSDMLRFCREGHLSYYRLEHLLPPEVSLNKAEISNLNPTADIGHKGLRQTVTRLAKFLGVLQLPHPNLLSLLERYITELNLPNGIRLYVERMIAQSPPNMEFNHRSVLYPNYEGRVMAFIIVAMKILFGLDGITEYEISRVIDRINTVAAELGELESRLFSFCEWQRFIECRRCIFVNEHFPTKLRRDPHSTGTNHLYVKFIQSIHSKYEGGEPDIGNFSNIVPRDLANMMKQSVERLSDNMPFTKNTVTFFPSLTPQHDYLQKLLEDPDKNLPSVLRQNFSTAKIGYTLKPELLEQLADQCNIELHVVSASAHFVEKIVQPFEATVMPSIRNQRRTNSHNNSTRVIAPNSEKSNINKSDDPSEYLHRKYPGTIVIDSKKQRLYNKSRNLNKNHQNNNCDDFAFDQILPNGQIKISKSDNELEDEESTSTNREKDYELMLSNFERQTMLSPMENPWRRYKQPLHRLYRNGKFVKVSDVIEDSDKETSVRSQVQDEIILIDDNTQSGKNENDDDTDPIIIKDVSECESEMNDSVSDEILILTENVDLKRSSNISKNSTTSERETLVVFRPFKQFWLHRCVHFSHIGPHHFRLLERDFPINFRWLLHECAHIVEMNPEELYEQVCMIEKYYVDVLSPKHDLDQCKKYRTTQYRSERYLKTLKNKWKPYT